MIAFWAAVLAAIGVGVGIWQASSARLGQALGQSISAVGLLSLLAGLWAFMIAPAVARWWRNRWIRRRQALVTRSARRTA